MLVYIFIYMSQFCKIWMSYPIWVKKSPKFITRTPKISPTHRTTQSDTQVTVSHTHTLYTNKTHNHRSEKHSSNTPTTTLCLADASRRWSTDTDNASQLRTPPPPSYIHFFPFSSILIHESDSLTTHNVQIILCDAIRLFITHILHTWN